MYPAAPNRIATQKVGSSQVVERRILAKQAKIINKMTKRWDKKTIRHLEHDCPKLDNDFLSRLLSSQTISPRLTLSSCSVIKLRRSITQY